MSPMHHSSTVTRIKNIFFVEGRVTIEFFRSPMHHRSRYCSEKLKYYFFRWESSADWGLIFSQYFGSSFKTRVASIMIQWASFSKWSAPFWVQLFSSRRLFSWVGWNHVTGFILGRCSRYLLNVVLVIYCEVLFKYTADQFRQFRVCVS